MLTQRARNPLIIQTLTQDRILRVQDASVRRFSVNGCLEIIPNGATLHGEKATMSREGADTKLLLPSPDNPLFLEQNPDPLQPGGLEKATMKRPPQRLQGQSQSTVQHCRITLIAL